MTAKADLIIRNGTVVDPWQGVNGCRDILIRGGKILAAPDEDEDDAAAEGGKVIEARGCLVFPGLIDYHAHLFYGGTEVGVHPDSALLPQGVTTAVDQGSAGFVNWESFFRTVISNSQVRIYSHLHVSPAGLATAGWPEPVDPRLYNLERVRSLFENYSGWLCGLKIRQSREVVGELGLAPLKAALDMAGELGCRVVVHTTNPPGAAEDLVSLLRPGDVFCHVYQGKGSTIIGAGGKVKSAVRKARDRGVVFDTADGRPHYAFSVIRAAIADGFAPDVISTDVVRSSLYEHTVFGLPFIMSKYLNLGLSLPSVVEACTAAPARLVGMQGRLGTLAPGASADVAIFKLKASDIVLRDHFGDSLVCEQILVPQMTIRGGKIVYRCLEF